MVRNLAMEVVNDVVRHAKRFVCSVEEEERWLAVTRRAIAGY
jgi:hypothetical protein